MSTNLLVCRRSSLMFHIFASGCFWLHSLLMCLCKQSWIYVRQFRDSREAAQTYDIEAIKGQAENLELCLQGNQWHPCFHWKKWYSSRETQKRRSLTVSSSKVAEPLELWHFGDSEPIQKIIVTTKNEKNRNLKYPHGSFSLDRLAEQVITAGEATKDHCIQWEARRKLLYNLKLLTSFKAFSMW